jgi:glycerol-1-phosphate dehydrogenase [NAD(P)+]
LPLYHAISLDELFDRTGFWEHWVENPMRMTEWEAALEAANSIKRDFVTVLSDDSDFERAREILRSNERLKACLAMA